MGIYEMYIMLEMELDKEFKRKLGGSFGI